MSTLRLRTQAMTGRSSERISTALQDLYREGTTVLQGYRTQWYENIAYLAGHQWAQTDLPTERYQLVYNLLQPAVRHAVSRMVARNPWLTALPASEEPSDLAAARLASKLLKHWRRAVFTHNLLLEHATWNVVCGTAFWKVGWDSHAGRSAFRRPLAPGAETILSKDRGPAEGEAAGAQSGFERFLEQLMESAGEEASARGIPGVTPGTLPEVMAEGDVLVEVVNPFEMILEPGVESWERLNWMMHARTRSREDVRGTWGSSVAKRAGPISDATPEAPGFDSRRIPIDLASFEMGQAFAEGDKTTEDDVLVLEYYERPSHEHMEGRRVMMVGGVVVEDRSNPFPFRDFPVVPTRFEFLPGRFWGRGLPRTLIAPQQEFNRTVSQMGEARDYTCHPKLVVPDNAQVKPDPLKGQMANMPGAVISVRGGGEKPFWLQAPQLPAHMGAELQQAYTIVQDLAHAHEASQGTTPPNVRSGIAFQVLQEADQRPLKPIYECFDEAISRVGFYLLLIAQRFYTETRTISLVGANKEPQVIAFRGADLRGVVDVYVEPRSAYADTLAANQERIFALYERGILGQPGDPVTNHRVLRALEMGHLTELFEGPQTLEELIITALRDEAANTTGGLGPLLQRLRSLAGAVPGPPTPAPQPQGAAIPGMGPVPTGQPS